MHRHLRIQCEQARSEMLLPRLRTIPEKVPRSLERCHTIADLRERAKRALPRPIFDFLDGGAETEVTAIRNTSAFDDIQLIPRCLSDISSIRTTTRVLGQQIEWPVLCAPTGASRLFHTEGEVAVARAAAAAGILYFLSVSSTVSLERVAAASPGPKVFQLYVRDRDLMWELIDRCKRADYCALCITVDAPVVGKRERDLRSGFGIRPKWSLRSRLSFVRHPLWVAQRMGGGAVSLSHQIERPSTAGQSAKRQAYPPLSWREIRDIADFWRGPLALKGLMCADDARRAADSGVSAVMVSNHGGRQLDGAASSIEVLSEIAKAVSDRVEVILDGGIRRGVHVLKALSLGARACSIGRPYLYGLSAGGAAGVSKALDILRTELMLAMQLSGCTDVTSVDATFIRQFGHGRY